MQFSGTFELEDTTREEVWLALSDPVLIKNALPGCQFLTKTDEKNPDFDALRETAEGMEWEISADPDVVAERAFEEGNRYAALMEISVGSVSPSFETVVTIDERDFPDMHASGEGDASNSSFEMDSGMHLEAIDDGVGVEWWAEADVFGRIAQMGQRVMNPVANRVVKRFFQRIQDQVEAMGTADEPTESDSDESGLGNRIRDRMGI